MHTRVFERVVMSGFAASILLASCGRIDKPQSNPQEEVVPYAKNTFTPAGQPAPPADPEEGTLTVEIPAYGVRSWERPVEPDIILKLLGTSDNRLEKLYLISEERLVEIPAENWEGLLLREVIDLHPKRRCGVSLVADRRTPFQTMVAALDVLNVAGATKVMIGVPDDFERD